MTLANLLSEKEIVGLFGDIFLEIMNMISKKLNAGFFAKKNITSAIKSYNILKIIFPHVFHEESADMLFCGAQFEKLFI